MRAILNRAESEQDAVYRWRVEELERAGYDPEAAEVLALSADVNLHDALDLIRVGCDQTVALNILL